jgi:predicted XRE-type DNA-binding protein
MRAKEELYAEVAKLYVMGYSQRQIAAKVGVTQPRIHVLLKKIREMWKERATQDYAARLAEELARMDAVEKEAWAAWERSQKDAETITVRENANGISEERQRKGQTGNVAYLETVQRCIETRLKLLGVLKNDPHLQVFFQANSSQTVNVGIDWDELYERQDLAANPVTRLLQERIGQLSEVSNGDNSNEGH